MEMVWNYEVKNDRLKQLCWLPVFTSNLPLDGLAVTQNFFIFLTVKL